MAPKAPQPEAMSPLGRLVKTAMDERRWSTRDVEAAGGPPASTTGRIINPRVKMRRPPADDTLDALARVLQIPEQRLQQAVAEMMSWDITDPMQHEPIRVVAAAMNRLNDRQQKAIAKLVVGLADELNLAEFPDHLAHIEPQELQELSHLRNAWMHQQTGADDVAHKALSIIEQLLGEENLLLLSREDHAAMGDLAVVRELVVEVPGEQPAKRAARKGIPARHRGQAPGEDQ